MQEGRVAFEQKHFSRAQMRFKAALKEAERLGEQHRSWAEALDQLAEVYLAQRKYADAERLYERALRAQQKTPNSSYASLAQSFDHLADLYSSQNKPVEADRMHARAREIREKMLAAHPDIYVDGQPKSIRPVP